MLQSGPNGLKVKKFKVYPTLLGANGTNVSEIKLSPFEVGTAAYQAGPGIIITNDVISASVDGVSIVINPQGQLQAVGGGSGTQGPTGPQGDTGAAGYAEFYYQSTVPTPDPLTLGARWIDSNNGIEYVWVFDGTSYVWMQPTQLGSIRYQASFINTPTYSPVFSYEYYGVTYMGGICTITLPLGTVPDDEGRFVTIADEVGGISNGGRGILVQGQGGQLINGSSSVLMKLERMSLTFLFRNNSWKTI